MSTITFKAHRCCFSDAALCFALKLSEKKKKLHINAHHDRLCNSLR